MTRCHHCNKKKKGPAYWRRGLCWRCFQDPEICAKYADKSKFGRRGQGSVNMTGKTPAEPTDAPPGSAAKQQVIAERISRGELMSHPEDAEY